MFYRRWILGIALFGLVFTSHVLAQPQTTDSAPDAAPRPIIMEADEGNRGAANTDSVSGVSQRQLGNVPDDIGQQLQQSEEPVDALFSRGLLTPLHEIWNGTTNQLNDRWRLDLGMNYTAVFQRADTVQSGQKSVLGGDIDFFGRWHWTGCDVHCPGAIVFNAEQRHKYTSRSPQDLDTGTLGGTIVSFDSQDLALVQLYWEQGSFENGHIVRVGSMDPTLIYDGGRYVSSNYAFLSPAFSDTLPMAFPDAGPGVAGAIYPTRSTYIIGGAHDANGQRTTSGLNSLFDDGEFFTALEFGWFPNEDEPDEGMYHVTFWNVDARRRAGRPNDRGVALTLEQQFGADGNFVPFLRYAYAHRGLNGVRQGLSIGLGLEEVLGQNFDIVGMAASWQEPSNRSLRDQYILEWFYRFSITPHTHLTPDVQLILDPSNAAQKDSLVVFGIRLRTLY